MAMTGNYKEYDRQPRVMTVEDLFNLGMSYVNTPLAEGYAKLLVNYDLKNQGVSLAPRGGLKLVNADMAAVTLPDTFAYAIHHVGSILVLSSDEQDATVHKYVLVAPVMTHAISGKLCYSFNQAYVFVETAAGYKCAQLNTTHYSNTRLKLTNVHNMTTVPADECNAGIYASIAANTYIPVFDVTGTERKFVQLKLKFNTLGDLEATLPVLDPKEVPASQAINSGYNMMKSDPYAFDNTENATGGLVLGGIIPKDLNGKLKLTNNVGEQIRYHLNYSYPISDLAKQYRVQWEVVDATTGSTTVMLQQVRRSPAYTPSSDIYFDYLVGYKQYTIVVKVYYKDVVDAHTFISEEDDAKTLTPLQVITVSSYTATSGSKNTANLAAKKYDLTTCTGICVWQQRTVLWGVKDAATTLFVSQPNLPEYVAYPNDVEIFNEDVVTCVPYLDYLLVFTTSKLYKLSFTTDGINVYYTTKCIQEHLPMTVEDASTIQIVKNLVYFKSNNYFYMIVPNTSAGVGELQLAPVSRPIESLLDNFSSALDMAINEVYNIPEKYHFQDSVDDRYALTMVDYINYMDGAILHNVYKVKVDIFKSGLLTNTHYLDFYLNYDAVLRAWTTYLFESTQFRLVPYEYTVIQGMQFVSLIYYTSAIKSCTLNKLTFDALSPKDEAPLYKALPTRYFTNNQFIDTGYRTHFPQYKKRFREIQFSINNTQQATLKFHTAFVLDDDVRKDLFEYEVVQITDPEDPDYGLIYVERQMADPISIEVSDKLYVANAVSFDATDPWLLDFSKFPTLTVAKVRYRVSGKGYLGKIKLLSNNDTMYELLGTNWVYRKMNAR